MHLFFSHRNVEMSRKDWKVVSGAVHTCEVPSVWQVRWVPGGHVSAFLLQQPAFRKAILDSLEQLANPVEDRAEAQSAAKAA